MDETRRDRALRRVSEERDRQDRLFEAGNILWDCSDPDVVDDLKLAVLGEEFGEVCRVMCECHRNFGASYAHLRDELTQTAAVAVAWLEAIEEELGES